MINVPTFQIFSHKKGGNCMDMKVAIVTDSTAYIPKTMRDQLSIHMVPLSVVFEEDTYEEEITISTETFYKKMDESPHLPTTSQPAIGQFVSLYSSLVEQG